MAMLTLKTLLEQETDNTLLNIHLEILSAIVPRNGYAQSYCRRINKMIDAGDCCISPHTYRRVYLPTLVKAVQKELARRYTQHIMNKNTTRSSQINGQQKLFQEDTK